jgi:hypothetical protein
VRRYCAALIAGLGLALAGPACGGTEDEPETGAHNLATLEAEVFNRCSFTSCHVGGGAAGLNLEAPIHGKIVNQPSSQFPDLVLVKPGSPGDSYLYVKLTATPPPEGKPMPFGGPLKSADIARVERWILDGALDD